MRCRPLLERSSTATGFRGLMTFTLPETLWLHEQGFDDLLLAYPTRGPRARWPSSARLEAERPPVVMVDSAEHLDLIDAAAGRAGADPRLHRDRPGLRAGGRRA